MSDKWDERFLNLARYIRSWSKDPSTRVGAVIVGVERRRVAFGYNGFPPGIADDDRLKDRETKYKIIQHAERNALDNCTFDPAGGTLYATQIPCLECTKSIIGVGISRVVCPDPGGLKKEWGDQVELTRSLMEEAGIELVMTDY